MADTNLPDPAPAPDGGTPQGTPPAPDPKPADAQPTGSPTLTIDSLSEDDRNYLKSQGVTELNAEAIQKVINHARTSQKTAADIKNRLDTVQKTITPEPDGGNPGTGSSGQPQPGGTPAPTSDLDQVTAFTLTNQLATQFTHLKDDLVSGKLYKDMQAIGIPLKQADGSVNLTGLLSYAKMVNDQRETEAKLAEASKPGEGAIPDANPSPAQPADDAPLTKQLAYAIVASGGKTHPRFEEAKQWLQKNVAGAK